MLASVEPPGERRSPGQSHFLLVIEPGPHVFTATRPGHRDVAVPKSYPPGAAESLDLRLDVLPAHITLESTPVRGIVRVNGREVGLAPTEFERPAGTYRVEVVHDDYESYTTTFDLHAGQRTDVTAKLMPRSLVKRWWFWTGVLAGAAGLTVGVTYAATHRTPDPPAYLGGTAGWVVPMSRLRW